MQRSIVMAALILAIGAPAPSAAQLPGADPGLRATAPIDPRRPPAAELATSVADGFTLALVGDMIVARPLTRAMPVPGFDDLIAVIRDADAAFGNLETSIVDIRDFAGAPYPYDGDWANIALPEVAGDLAMMGFDLLGRANNHVADWGPEGMRETGARLDAAGIAHAGTGETAAAARAPVYHETSRGRVALVSFATTFRPTSEAMPPRGTAPGRPGLSALHLALAVHVTDDQMRALAVAACTLGRPCEPLPATLALGGTRYVRDGRAYNEWVPDPEDMAAILRSIREARQHADFVIVAIHAHECAWDCDATTDPALPGAFLEDIAHAAIDAGGDVFTASGIHNLGPIEIYRDRPIFYGLANFFWSDIQEPVPHELFQRNRAMMADAYTHPERATDYDLTGPLNAGSFATAHTFQSVAAEVRFARGRLAAIRLHPVDLGYGETLRSSGTPRLERDARRARGIFDQIVTRTAAYGLPAIAIAADGTVAPRR